MLWPRVSGPLGPPEGSDYGQYLHSADFIWHHPPDGKYFDWRKPFYPYLLGLFGEHVGYVAAGLSLARLASLLLVGSSAGFARLLAGPWAGGAAAVLAARLPLVGKGADWVNVYPLLGAACGLAYVGAAWSTRRGQPAAAALTGLAAGAALLLDGRGLFVALPCLLVAAGSCLDVGTWRRRAGGALVLAVSFGGLVAVDRQLPVSFHVPQMALWEAVHAQGQVAHDARVTPLPPAAGGSHDPCTGAPTLTWRHAVSPCATELRRAGVSARIGSRDLPPLTWLGLVVLAAAPGAWRAGDKSSRRAALRSAVGVVLLYGSAALAVAAAAGLAPLPDRYLAPFVVPIAALVPVALGRLAGTVHALLGREGQLRRGLGRLLPPAAALVAVAWSLTAWLGLKTAPNPIGGDRPAVAAARAWALDVVAPGDTLYDCTSLDIAPTLLPTRPTIGRCPSNLLERPDELPGPEPVGRGSTWLLARPASPQDARRLEELLATRGWRRLTVPAAPFGLSMWQGAAEGS